jgi:hypothetical protein
MLNRVVQNTRNGHDYRLQDLHGDLQKGHVNMIKHVDRWLRCERRGTHFLSGDAVHEIRYLVAAGWTRYSQAKVHGVSWRTIDRVVKHQGRYAKPLSKLGDGFNREYHPPRAIQKYHAEPVWMNRYL